jgi:uncharacterized protein (DUF433 family)
MALFGVVFFGQLVDWLKLISDFKFRISEQPPRLILSKSIIFVQNFSKMELQHAKFHRITTNPEVCTGQACIRGIRFPVSTLIGYLAAGVSNEELLEDFPFLEKEDIQEALAFAASQIQDRFVPFYEKVAA